MSAPYRIDSVELTHIGMVCLYSAGSAVVASLIAILANMHVPSQDLFLVPVANTLLVALEQFFKSNSPKP